jgi:hypothetical protein
MRQQLPAVLLGCLLLSSAFAGQLSAQPASAVAFAWGEEYKLPKKHEDLGFIGNFQDGYIQIGHRAHKSLTFQKFSPSLQLLGEQEVDLGDMPRDYSSEELTQIGNKYYWFVATYDKGEHKESLLAQEIDVKKGGTVGSWREVLTASKLTGTLISTGFYRFGIDDKWHFYSSFDKSKILVEYRKQPERRDNRLNNDVIGLQVLDASLNKIWGREVRMPYTEDLMDNEGYQVDAQGNVYILAKIYAERGMRPQRHTNYRFEILKWTADGSEVTKIRMPFSDRFVNAATITEDAMGRIVVAGYYSGKKPAAGGACINPLGFYTGSVGGSVDGAFVLRLNEQTNELDNIRQGSYEFSAAVLKQYESRHTRRRIDRKDEKGRAEANNLLLRKVLLNEDGSIELYGEEAYEVTSISSNGKTTTSTTTYFYKDVLALKIGTDGKLQWMAKIPKQQQGKKGLGDMSFTQFSFHGDSYVLFMDNLKNLDIAPDETPATHADGAGGILMANRIDASGHLSKVALYDVRKAKVKLSVTNFGEVGNNQLIARGRAKHRECKPALISFQ